MATKIETEEEYKRLLSELERLSDMGPGYDAATLARLTELGPLVEPYEEEHFPIPRPDPAAMAAYIREEVTSIRVFLDDVRDTPDGWLRAYTAHECIALLESGRVTELSLDHDLGDDEANGTGYTVVCWVEEQVALHGFVPPVMRIHSANAVGVQKMQLAIESIERLSKRRTP